MPVIPGLLLRRRILDSFGHDEPSFLAAKRPLFAGDHIDIMQVCLDARQFGVLRESFNASIS
jgi:hypothetical protein